MYSLGLTMRQFIKGVDTMSKVCTVCKKEKSLDDFYNLKASKDGKSWRCKKCDSQTTMNSRKKKYEQNKEYHRTLNRLYKYNLTKEGFQSLLDSQQGLCACCHQPLTQDFGRNHDKRKLVVDHCHKTGEVRGLLCTMCNKGIGLLGDNAKSVLAAYEYLKKFEEVH